MFECVWVDSSVLKTYKANLLTTSSTVASDYIIVNIQGLQVDLTLKIHST